MRTTTKDRIAKAFLEWPVIHMLVRAILFSVWFRLVFFGLLLLPLVLAAALAKIWRATPAGFRPVVRISCLDWLQARSLERTALDELAKGRVQEGMISYSMAFANNPGNLRLARASLRQIYEKVQPPEFQMMALQRAFWLLRLTRTNLVDLELVAGVLQKYGLDHFLLSVLVPQKARLTPTLQKSLLRSLFNGDRISEFDQAWHALDSVPEIQADPEMELYRAAFTGMWGTADVSARPGRRLEDNLSEGPWRVLAHRLYLRVCERRLDADGYFATMQHLEDWKKTRLIDQIRGWQLLDRVGRRDEAVRRAKSFADSPITGVEAIELAQAYHGLGLREHATRLLDQSATEFGFLDGLWALYGNLLLITERWDELRLLALRIRLTPEVGDRLSGFSYYLEGRAELAQGRPGVADGLFARIAARPPENLEMALFVSRGLCESGLASIARDVMIPLEEAGRQNPSYWEMMVMVAYGMKDEALLSRAAAAAFALSPTSWPAQNNFAAALAITGRLPGEAVKETFQLFSRFPESPSIRINHALALLQNHRYAEADGLLAVLDASALKESERTVYSLACFATLMAQKRFDLARRFQSEIDPAFLFPTQTNQLNQLRLQLAEVDGPRSLPTSAQP